MADLPVPSLQTGGLWWFTDLTACDPFYILPIAVTGTMFAILEVNKLINISSNSKTVSFCHGTNILDILKKLDTVKAYCDLG